MEHDTDEWRQPWRSERRPSPPGVTFVNGEVRSGPGTPAASHEQAPSTADRVETAPMAGPVIPASPAPPPPGWGAADEGPGSPRGSVRPPDTIGTVDAPVGRPGAGRRGFTAGLIGALVGAVLGTAGTLAVVRQSPAFTGASSVEAPTVPVVSDQDGDERATNVVTAVARAVTPSVVRIDVSTAATDGAFGRGAGIGSGVIYRSDGYVLTNNHVVEDAEAVEVKFADGETVRAEVIGTDPLNDLAVVKVDRTGLPAITIREDPAVQVGETAIAIGSPFGLDASVTAGVISALNRDLEVPNDDGTSALLIPAVIQTDAAINPGNSGGALVDAQGRLVGINTAILSGSGGSQGVGFAIPVLSAVSSADQLIEQGFVRHPFLGIGGVDVTPEVADRVGLDEARGAVIENIVEGSGAAEAGLEVGDVILAIGGDRLESMTDLIVQIREYEPGDTITLTIFRDGGEQKVEVVLGERPR